MSPLRILQQALRALRTRYQILLFRTRYPRVKIFTKLQPELLYSQLSQDYILLRYLFQYLQDFDSPFWVVDVGANHPIKFSNSYFFEKYLRAKVLAIEPLTIHNDEWSVLRPSAILCNNLISTTSGAKTIYTPIKKGLSEDLSMFSSCSPESIKKINSSTSSFVPTTVSSCPLQTLLDKYQIKSAALCSIDVEGFELDVVMSIDFSAVHIPIFLIENNTDSVFGSHDLRVYMRSKGYAFVARTWSMDDIYILSSKLK